MKVKKIVYNRSARYLNLCISQITCIFVSFVNEKKNGATEKKTMTTNGGSAVVCSSNTSTVCMYRPNVNVKFNAIISNWFTCHLCDFYTKLKV